jgi:uncharacterized protein (TIGR03000 family)
MARLFAAVVVGLGSGLTCAAPGGGGHGGGGHAYGGGHAFGGYGGYGFRGGYGYRGFYGYGYPGWYGLGLGLGLGYGLGYGYGYGYPYYGYPYSPYGYPCDPYGGGYPVYVNPGYGPPPAASTPVCPVAGQGVAPASLGGAATGAPVRLTDSDVLLSIRVPPDAAVWINGEQTAQSGPRREFASSGLEPGRTYTFVVTARWAGPDGQVVELERRVHVQGGERRNLNFLTPPPPPRDLPLLRRAGN